jgi:hypothetical protein
MVKMVKKLLYTLLKVKMTYEYSDIALLCKRVWQYHDILWDSETSISLANTKTCESVDQIYETQVRQAYH